MTAAAWVCLVSPLVAAVLLTLGGTAWSRRAAGYLATLSTAVSFGAAVVCFFSVRGRSDDNSAELTTAWTWLSAGDLDVGLTLLVDPLSILMMLIVTGVGSLIVAYSIGYMDGDDEERRYFAYMALFVFSMLLLVMGGNFLMLLVGWGLVGLCSYLLIGYHHERPSAVAAAKKAFIMNAVGDATMALAFFLLIQRTGSLDFGPGVEWASGAEGSWAVNLVALGLLGGAVAKSAQIPLQTWLPDAMEGPTPVSALIHAATMVTAGVYLLVRLGPLFEYAPNVQHLAAGLGAITLLAAGLIALVQVDIKRVIAYSTMSQIGYMFLAAGLGAYANAMFHLMTHAFFKALLFLAAGIVIHALAGEQDMRKMGGLRRLLPRTWVAFLIGAAALTGIPPLSGFWSKDSILASGLAEGAYGQAALRRGHRRRLPHGSLHVPDGLHGLRRRAVGLRTGALAQAGADRALDLDGGDRRSARRAVGDRRLAPDPPPVAPLCRLPAPRGGAALRADRHAGRRSPRSPPSRSASSASGSPGGSTRPGRSPCRGCVPCRRSSSTSSTSTRRTTGSSTGLRPGSRVPSARSSSGR